MRGEIIVYILFLVILCSCTNKKAAESKNEPKNNIATINVKQNDVKSNIKPTSSENSYANLRILQKELDEADLSKPSSLREISQRITEDEMNRVYYISIRNGENINSLDGIELFPCLQYLSIHNSPMKTLQGILDRDYNLLRLTLVGNALEDVSDVVLFKNLNELILRSERLKHFNISNMENLGHLYIQECTGIDFSSLKLPENLGYINLFGCNIVSLRDVAVLFDYCEILVLDGNPINEIERDLNFGKVKRISLVGCPVADKYYDKTNPDENPYQEINGVIFNFYDPS